MARPLCFEAGQPQANWSKLAASPDHDKGEVHAMAEPSVLPLALFAQPERNTSERFDGG
jgi:hypothetical protein